MSFFKRIQMIGWLIASLLLTNLSARTAESQKISTDGPKFEVKSNGENDPFLQMPLSDWTGKLAYAFTGREFDSVGQTIDKPSPTYLALRERTSSGQESATFYEYKMPPRSEKQPRFFSVFDPQFSPDGRYLLFKWGGRDVYDSYRLFVMELKSQRISMVSSPNLTCRNVRWSPDSKYLAFIEGGDAEGNLTRDWIDGPWYLGPLKLYVCEWQTGRRWLVAQSDSVKESFSWAAPHYLLYSMLPEAKKATSPAKQPSNQQPKSKVPAMQTKVAIVRPNIYEFSPDTDQSRLILRDGLRPHVSPDGNFIAFWGSENATKPHPLPSDWLTFSRNASLCVARRDATARVPLNLETGKYSKLIWSPDSKFVITVRAIDREALEKIQTPRLDVIAWSVVEQTQNKIASLDLKSFGAAILRLAPRTFSPDGSLLHFSTFQMVGYRVQGKRHHVMTDQEALHSLNMKTGKVETQLRFKHNWGFDWFAEIAPNTQPLRPAQ